MSPDKKRESAFSPLVPTVTGQPIACGNAYVKHLAKYPDFFGDTMLATLAVLSFSLSTIFLKPGAHYSVVLSVSVRTY